MKIINEYGETEKICDNAKYNSKLDAYVCYCCGKNDTQAKDLKLWQKVILKRDNSVWFIRDIVNNMLYLVPTKSIKHKNAGITVYDFMVK